MAKPELLPVSSSAFDGYHYDETTSTLTVAFKNGSTWTYDDVPIEKAVTFANSASPGAYFAARIRGLYTGRKL